MPTNNKKEAIATNKDGSMANNVHHASDHDLLVLINKAAIITSFITFAYAASSVFFPNGKLNAIISTSIGLIFLAVHLFYRYRKLEALKLYFSLVVPIWIFTDTICLGGDYSQSAGFLAIISLMYVFYEHQKVLQRILVTVVLCLFTFSSLFVKYHGTIFEEVDQPFDEILVMVVSVIWVFSILNKRDRENRLLIEHLEQKNKYLKATTEELERFTNIASHDLKSPLRNISSFLGLIERDLKRGDTANLQYNLEFAKKGAQQMHYLIQGILEISSINHHAHPNKQEHNLSDLMEIVIANLSLEIKEKNAVVSYQGLPSYRCNDVEFTLLFQNLLQNGIKYNKSPQPKVVVSTEHTPEHIKIIFEDNGIGIEPQYHDYIFEHFKRLHTSNEYMGTGLGLSLCRKIAQKNHGEIRVVSELGKGSKFIVELPANPA